MHKITLAKLASMAAIAVTMSALGALPANAAELAPTCVGLSVSHGAITTTAKAYNGCTASKRLKLVWSFTNDSSCASLAVGYTRTYTAPWYASPDRLELC